MVYYILQCRLDWTDGQITMSCHSESPSVLSGQSIIDRKSFWIIFLLVWRMHRPHSPVGLYVSSCPAIVLWWKWIREIFPGFYLTNISRPPKLLIGSIIKSLEHWKVSVKSNKSLFIASPVIHCCPFIFPETDSRAYPFELGACINRARP